MAIIKRPVTIERGLRAEFQRALDIQPSSELDRLMLRIRSTTRDEKYAWLEDVPQLRELKDHVEVNSVFESSYSVVNKTYHGVISVSRNDLADDQVGGAFMRVRELAIRGREFPQKLLMDTIIAGDTDLAYDGLSFFNVAHLTGDSGTQSNLLTGTGTTLTDLKTDFDSALEAMMGYKDASGEPIHPTDVNLRPLIVCPTSLFGSFRDLANAAIISNTTNTIQGAFDLVASPHLNDDDVNDWYMFDVGSTRKPYIIQEREPLEFSTLEQASDIGFIKEEYLYKARWRGAVANGFWQKGVKITNT